MERKMRSKDRYGVLSRSLVIEHKLIMIVVQTGTSDAQKNGNPKHQSSQKRPFESDSLTQGSPGKKAHTIPSNTRESRRELKTPSPSVVSEIVSDSDMHFDSDMDFNSPPPLRSVSVASSSGSPKRTTLLTPVSTPKKKRKKGPSDWEVADFERLPVYQHLEKGTVETVTLLENAFKQAKAVGEDGYELPCGCGRLRDGLYKSKFHVCRHFLNCRRWYDLNHPTPSTHI